jgi:uncharacterized membrane protein YebE (DUF533 family)
MDAYNANRQNRFIGFRQPTFQLYLQRKLLMKLSSTSALSALFACTMTLASAAHAQSATPRIDQREANQSARIDQGVASGQLTQREATRMRAGQTHVLNMEDRAKADGTVTGKERARIEHAQDTQSARIYRQKHDRQKDLNHDGLRDKPQR